MGQASVSASDIKLITAATPAAKRTYRADIDGLRALAVVSVLLFHGGVSAFSGGYVGVDIFFVISGFVIAQSINRDLEGGRFSLAGFYERRARRILPALTLVLMAVLAAALWMAPPLYFAPFAASLASAGSFLSNVHFWREGGYFASEAPFQPLLHTWSLGVEEQYYLLAPILIYLTFRFFGRRWAAGIVPVLAISFALSIYAIASQRFDAAFYLLPTRAWEILLGALVALSPPPPLQSRLAREALSIVALALIAFAVFAYRPDTPFPGLAALPPCLGAAGLLYLGMSPKPTSISRVLAWRPFVAVGLISYSLYLVHWPIIIMTRFALARPLTAVESIVAITACVILAAAMFVLIEQPLRRMPASTTTVFAVSAVAILTTVAAGLLSPALNQRIFAASAVANYKPDISDLEKSFKTSSCLLVTGQPYHQWKSDQCVRANGSGDNVLLFGDSFAAHYTPGLEAMSDQVEGRIIQYTMQGCAPILRNEHEELAACRQFSDHVTEVIEQGRVKRVILSGSWLEYGADFSVGVESTLKAFREMGLEVTLIGQSPTFYLDPLVIAARTGGEVADDVSVDIGDQAARLNARLHDLASIHGAEFIDPIASLCRSNVCPIRVNGEQLFADYGHFTEAGSRLAVKTYFPYLSTRPGQ